MTHNEKRIAASLHFSYLWFHLWGEFLDDEEAKDAHPIKWDDVNDLKKLRKPPLAEDDDDWRGGIQSRIVLYKHKKAKFDQTFVADGGQRMKAIMAASRHVELQLELPKGGQNPNETLMCCAIREFEQETNVPSKLYQIMPDVKPIVESYKDAGVNWVQHYWLAHTSIDYTPQVRPLSIQSREIDSVKWATLEDIKREAPHLVGAVERAFEIVKSKRRSRRNHLKL
jgi:8-oxo-dGTP pyrophosphatase MutT (NUDIX family)